MYRSFHTTSNSLKVREVCGLHWCHLSYNKHRGIWNDPLIPSGSSRMVLLDWRPNWQNFCFLKTHLQPKFSCCNKYNFGYFCHRVFWLFKQGYIICIVQIYKLIGMLELSPCCSCPLLISWRSQWPGQTTGGGPDQISPYLSPVIMLTLVLLRYFL